MARRARTNRAMAGNIPEYSRILQNISEYFVILRKRILPEENTPEYSVIFRNTPEYFGILRNNSEYSDIL
jgi:hypothetical protein